MRVPESPALERLSVIGGISNPSWVEVSPSGRNLYAVGEETHGVIKAYAIDSATGALTYLNEQLTGGEVPCHISVDATEAYVLLANYGSGSVAMLPIRGGRKPGPADRLRSARGIQHSPRTADWSARPLDHPGRHQPPGLCSRSGN